MCSATQAEHLWERQSCCCGSQVTWNSTPWQREQSAGCGLCQSGLREPAQVIAPLGRGAVPGAAAAGSVGSGRGAPGTVTPGRPGRGSLGYQLLTQPQVTSSLFESAQVAAAV